MIITPIRQGDPRWKYKRIGNSGTNVGRDGCTISSCSMALEKLRGYFCNPGSAAYYWKFDYMGRILWRKCNFKGMEFIWRGYYGDKEKVAEYANDPHKAAILEVNHGAHWVYLEKVVNGKLHIIDPIDGKRYAGLPRKYKFTGYALFEGAKPETPKWMEKAIAKGEARGLDLDSPLSELNVSKIEEVLFDLGIAKEKTGKITWGRFLVLMDKIKELW